MVIEMIRTTVDAEAGSIECRKSVRDAYNEVVDRAHRRMVWTHPGMTTYYRNSRGRVTVSFPFRNTELFRRTRSVNLDEFLLEPRAAER